MVPSLQIKKAQHSGMACTGLHVDKVAFVTRRTKMCEKDFNSMVPSLQIRKAQLHRMACTGLHVENVAFITRITKMCKKDFNMSCNQPDQLQQ